MNHPETSPEPWKRTLEHPDTPGWVIEHLLDDPTTRLAAAAHPNCRPDRLAHGWEPELADVVLQRLLRGDPISSPLAARAVAASGSTTLVEQAIAGHCDFRMAATLVATRPDHPEAVGMFAATLPTSVLDALAKSDVAAGTSLELILRAEIDRRLD